MSVIRAAVYCRVSKPGQAAEDKISIPDQLKKCKELIENQGWVFVEAFIDPGYTSATIERPGLKKLFSSLEKLDVIVAWDFDRYFRERRAVAGYILDTVDEHRKQITSVTQPIPIYDPRTYDPRENDTPYLLRELAGLTSGIDNRRRRRRIALGLKAKEEQGYMVKPPPYGYRVAVRIEDGKAVKLPRQVVPEQAQVVRRIYESYKDGKSYVPIARDLNNDGIASPKGCQWFANTVRGIVRSPVYYGMAVKNHGLRNGRKRVRLPEENWRVIPGKHRPIITKALWNEVQMIRKGRWKKARAIGSPLLLSGLLKCGYCEFAMCKDGSWGGGYYICGNHKQSGKCTRNPYRRLHLEDHVLDYLFGVLRREDIYDKVRVKQQEEKVRDFRDEVARLEKLLAELPKKKNKLFELFENEDISRDEFLKRKEYHLEVEKQYTSSLLEKKELIGRHLAKRVSRETFEKTMRSLEKTWERCDMIKKKQKLHSVIEKIVVKDRSFKLYFRLPSAFAE